MCFLEILNTLYNMFYNKTTINVLYVLLPVLYSLLENAKDYLSPPLLLLSHVTSRHLTFINLYSKCSRETVNCHHFLTIASDERSRALQNTVVSFLIEMKNFFKSFRQNLISILKRGANRSFFNFLKKESTSHSASHSRLRQALLTYLRL